MYLTITLVYGICLRNIPSWEGQGWVSSDLAIHPSGSRYRVYTPNPFSPLGEGEPDSKSLSLLNTFAKLGRVRQARIRMNASKVG
jgi:hypothetical protein